MQYNAIDTEWHWSFHQLRSWAADGFTSVKNHSCHPLQWEGPVTTYRLQHVAAHCVWSNQGDSNKQTNKADFSEARLGPRPSTRTAGPLQCWAKDSKFSVGSLRHVINKMSQRDMLKLSQIYTLHAIQVYPRISSHTIHKSTVMQTQ